MIEKAFFSSLTTSQWSRKRFSVLAWRKISAEDLFGNCGSFLAFSPYLPVTRASIALEADSWTTLIVCNNQPSNKGNLTHFRSFFHSPRTWVLVEPYNKSRLAYLYFKLPLAIAEKVVFLRLLNSAGEIWNKSKETLCYRTKSIKRKWLGIFLK